jgi:hypothetical protein
MSNRNKVALVSVNRVVAQVRRHVGIDETLITKIARKKVITREEARNRILSSITKTALQHSGGDEKKAGTALIIVNGKSNRLAQCAKLLRQHPPKVVRTAYEMKEELGHSSAPLRLLCQLLEHTDTDMEGESTRVRAMLDELGMSADSPRQEAALFHKVLKEVRKGRLIEAVVEEIIDEVEVRRKPGDEIAFHEQRELEESYD